jgi:peptidylprolyl isomerase
VSRRLAAVGLAMALVLGGCSDDGDEETVDAGGEPADCRTAEEARSAETPEVDAPAEKATELVVTDLAVGCGAEIPEGAVVNVEVNYLGKAHSTGQEFDSSFARGVPASFPVGAGGLIEGWDTGLVGMKEGGRRQLLVPGDLAYGPMGSPPDIGPDDTLVFVIDLLSVQG